MQLRSQTVAELKQNEIQLVHSDLKASTLSIQDFISWNDAYVSDKPGSKMKFWERNNYMDWLYDDQGLEYIENIYDLSNDRDKMK